VPDWTVSKKLTTDQKVLGAADWKNVGCRLLDRRLLLEMLQTLEAHIDENGQIRLLEPLTLSRPSRVLVTILPSHSNENSETALLSEASLAVDWNRKEEDEAWAHLQ
jgi:hypothetical protein